MIAELQEDDEGGNVMISLQTAMFRLTLALVLGALVGLERERGERAAGIRTHALVALGSCLVMIVSTFGFADILGTPSVVLDPSRIAAQVISGIGFLGAGTILLRKEIIKGLTTAAAIWVVAAIGLACGCGLWLEAVAATLLMMIVLVALRPVHAFFRRSTMLYLLHIETNPAQTSLLPALSEVFQRTRTSVEQVQVQTGRKGEKIAVECRAANVTELMHLIQVIRDLPDVQTVHLTLRQGDLTGLASLSALRDNASSADLDQSSVSSEFHVSPGD